jgi:hypothetical protein
MYKMLKTIIAILHIYTYIYWLLPKELFSSTRDPFFLFGLSIAYLLVFRFGDFSATLIKAYGII